MNRRSKIAVRWTTDPAVLGYGAPDEVRDREFAQSTPDFIGSPRTALDYAAGIRRMVGDGVVYSVLLTACATGKPVEADDLRAVLA